MDPLSQGVAGATLSQVLVKDRKRLVIAGVLGFLSGMAADLDVLIRSQQDPLLTLEFHRQFTHALIFIPIGGLICAAFFHSLFTRRILPFRLTYLYCTLGYATHGLLDACTTYGTQLFWPFSTTRVAWNVISIIDPLFTLPILTLIVLATVRRQVRWARYALVYAFLYFSFGIIQRERAEAVGAALAAERGHVPIELEAKPSFANLIVWKVVYETEDSYFVDAIRTGWRAQPIPGESILKLDVGRDFPWLDNDSQHAKDIERFAWFSNGYVAKDPSRENCVIDIRYSMVPNEIQALWGVCLNPDAQNEHVRFETFRMTSENIRSRFWKTLFPEQEQNP